LIVIKLTDMLNKRGMTMYQLSKKTGVRPNTISQWVNNEVLREDERGVKAINLEVLNSICKELNCQIHDIIEYIPDNDEKTP
jgi:putative transcriptional regulator